MAEKTSPKKRVFVNRELSWIDFNLRVLEEAQKTSNPLFERYNFISIFESNFDEFFRVRVGSLRDKLLVSEGSKAEKSEEMLGDIYKSASKAVKLLDKAFAALLFDSASVLHRITACHAGGIQQAENDIRA